MSDLILVEEIDGVMTIRMNRPDKKNALTVEMYSALSGAIDNANANPTVGSITILGTPGSFCAGNDIADFLKMAEGGNVHASPVFDFLERIIIAEKPLVAGVDGLAIGVGTTMLLHCDYVIASDKSLFRTPFTDLGLVPEAGSSLIAPRLMGYQRAFELLVMGKPFNATQALETGIINQIVPAGRVETEALAAALEITSKPRESLKLSRNLVRGDRTDILARMREEALLFDERLKSDEAKAAFEAFLSKGKKST